MSFVWEGLKLMVEEMEELFEDVYVEEMDVGEGGLKEVE